MAGEIKKVLFSEGVSVAEPAAVDLAYTGTANVFTESQTLDNQKEYRCREATANGTNYASIKAPASLAATYDLTLPTDDGSSGQVLQTDGSGVLSWTDGGGGSGEKNYITNPSAKSAITGWTNVGDLDVARTTTAGDLPREYTTASGIKITADANTQSTADYVYYDFTLDDVDLSKKLKIQWAQKTTGTYTAGQLAVVITTQADRTTALHTPVTTAIPAADGVFTTSFDASTTATLSLVIRATTDMTTDGGIVISDVVVGPGIQHQGAVVGEWQSYTPTGTWIANTTYTGKYRRVGDTLCCRINGSLSGVPTATALAVDLPSGLTMDTTKLNSVANPYLSVLGHGKIKTSAGTPYLVTLGYTDSNTIGVYNWDDAATGINLNAGIQDTVPFSMVSGVTFELYFEAPIAEWAGSGTVNLAQNDVEYAYNTTLTDASDTSAFGYGSGGSQFANFTAKRVKRVRFQTAIQPTDRVVMEVTTNSGTTWVDFSQSSIIGTYQQQNGVEYGVNISAVAGTSTDIDVEFLPYRLVTGTTYGSAGGLWSAIDNDSTYKWRLRKIAGGQAVGYGHATATQTGLAPAGVFQPGQSGVIDLQEVTATPSDPTLGAEGKIYLKGDKLIIQFNDGGTVRYKYLDLTGTGVTWVHTTSAP